MQDSVRVVDRDDVAVFLDGDERLPQLRRHPEHVHLRTDCPGGAVLVVTASEEFAEPVQRTVENAVHAPEQPGFRLGEPLVRVPGLVEERRGGPGDERAVVGGGVVEHALDESPVEVARLDVRGRQDIHDEVGPRDRLVREAADDLVAERPELGEVLPGQVVVRPSERDEVRRGLAEPAVEGEFPRGLQVVLHPGDDPSEESLVRPVEGVKEPLDALIYEGVPVQLDLIGGEAPYLAGEGPEGLLEELVDGRHGEGRIVVEDGREHRPRLRLHRTRGREDVRDEVDEVRRAGRVRGERVELLEDTALHLVCGFVGEGHGEDMPVGVGPVRREEQADVFLREVVGLSASGGCFEDLDWHG